MKQKSEEKQLIGYFKRQTSEILPAKACKWLQKGNLKRDIKSLLIAIQNNAIRTNYIKTGIDKTRQNSNFRLIETKRSIT